jgi:hypothetical protein
MMLVVGLVVVLIILGGAAVLVYMNKDKLFKKKEVEEVEEVEVDEGPVVNVTEDGSSIEKYRSGTENYLAFPKVDKSVSPYTVYAYNPNDSKVTSNMMGSSETWNNDTKKCPDGTLDCLYYERVTDGRVTAITDKDGKDLIKTFIDDYWGGKLTAFDEHAASFELKMNEGGAMYTERNGTKLYLKPGVNFPPGVFLLALLINLKKKYPKKKPVIKIDLPAKTRKEIDDILQELHEKAIKERNAKDGPGVGPK